MDCRVGDGFVPSTAVRSFWSNQLRLNTEEGQAGGWLVALAESPLMSHSPKIPASCSEESH